MRLVVLALGALVLSACGGSSSHPDLTGARAKTTAAGTARFTLGITASSGGTTITADENGTASFGARRAHLYKLLPGGTTPQEVVVIGPFTYTNGNVDAALQDRTIRPWTKLDTRRLSAAKRRTQLDEVAHVLAPAYLADGVAHASRVGTTKGLTELTGRVDPTLLERHLPPAQRAAIMAAVRRDYSGRPFDATFWLDNQGRVRRVLVAYKTPQGTSISVDASYSNFGAAVDLTLPRASEIQDISP